MDGSSAPDKLTDVAITTTTIIVTIINTIIIPWTNKRVKSIHTPHTKQHYQTTVLVLEHGLARVLIFYLLF